MDINHEIDVISLDAAHRRAFEDVIGIPLEQNQRLVISVIAPTSRQSLADWIGVYDGLTEDQVDAIDRDLKTRANLKFRPSCRRWQNSGPAKSRKTT